VVSTLPMAKVFLGPSVSTVPPSIRSAKERGLLLLGHLLLAAVHGVGAHALLSLPCADVCSRLGCQPEQYSGQAITRE
jgi:hypothetical protein